MTTEAKKTDAKAANCAYMPGCCEPKATKASNASQKAEVKQEKSEKNPVLIMSAPVELSNQD